MVQDGILVGELRVIGDPLELVAIPLLFVLQEEFLCTQTLHGRLLLVSLDDLVVGLGFIVPLLFQYLSKIFLLWSLQIIHYQLLL